MRRLAVPGEVEDVLVTVVDEARAVDGLVMAHRQIAVERGAAGGVAIDGDRLDPVDGVLQREHPARHPGDVEPGPGIGWLRADVKEERAVRGQDAGDGGQPLPRPSQVGPTGQRVVVRAVTNAEVVGRRGDDDVDGIRLEPCQQVEAVAVEERPRAGAARDGAQWGRQRREAPHARKDSAPLPGGGSPRRYDARASRFDGNRRGAGAIASV